MADANLRQIFRVHLPEFDFQSVETWSTGRGVPDLNYCCDGVEGWIEFKAAHGWRVTITPEQVGWAERRLRAGGRVFVAARRVNKRSDELYLFSGWAARGLASGELQLATGALANWAGGPRNWDWHSVKSLLLRYNFVPN